MSDMTSYLEFKKKGLDNQAYQLNDNESNNWYAEIENTKEENEEPLFLSDSARDLKTFLNRYQIMK